MNGTNIKAILFGFFSYFLNGLPLYYTISTSDYLLSAKQTASQIFMSIPSPKILELVIIPYCDFSKNLISYFLFDMVSALDKLFI